MKTATEMMMRIDLRRRRAYALVHAIMQKIRPFLAEDRDAERDAHDALFDLLSEGGFEVLSDHDRAEIGLPPRGPDGWTEQEIHALEALRLSAIMRPISMPSVTKS